MLFQIIPTNFIDAKRIQADMCSENRLSSSFKVDSNNLQDSRSKALSYTFICQKYDLTREKKQYKENILYVKRLRTVRNIMCPFWHTHRP